MALYGPLEGPRGAVACEFFIFHILLLNVLQTRPGLRFFTNLLRKSKEYKANGHKFGFLLIVPHIPKRGVSRITPAYEDLGNKAKTFFYLKLDIKSKLFTNANLPRTKKSLIVPSRKTCNFGDFCNFRDFRGFDTSTLTHFGGLFLNTYGLKTFFPLLYI